MYNHHDFIDTDDCKAALVRSRTMSRADSANILKDLASFTMDGRENDNDDDDEEEEESNLHDQMIKCFDDSSKIMITINSQPATESDFQQQIPVGFSPVANYRRTASLSLKSSLKKPGSSKAKKKMVRFADSLNVDLEAKHTSCGSKVEQFYSSKKSEDLIKPHFAPLFKLMSVRLIDRVVMDRNPVCLESISVRNRIIRGVVKVKNIACHKSVTIRYTTNGWQSYVDHVACYINGTCDGFCDKFSFVLDLFSDKTDHVEFAIKYSVANCEYWDNNNHKNYCFEYQDATKSKTKLFFAWFDDAWLHFR